MTSQRHMVRITVDVEVAIDPDHTDTRGAWDVEKERALLLAIMANPAALRHEVIAYALTELDSAHRQLEGKVSAEDDAVLAPVLRSLPDDLRAYFERWKHEQLYPEATEYVSAAFTPTVHKATVEMMPDGQVAQ